MTKDSEETRLHHCPWISGEAGIVILHREPVKITGHNKWGIDAYGFLPKKEDAQFFRDLADTLDKLP